MKILKTVLKPEELFLPHLALLILVIAKSHIMHVQARVWECKRERENFFQKQLEFESVRIKSTSAERELRAREISFIKFKRMKDSVT